MVQSQILPAAAAYQKSLAQSIKNAMDVIGDGKELGPQKELLRLVSTLISDAQKQVGELKKGLEKAKAIDSEEKQAAYFCDVIKPCMGKVRQTVDTLELYVDNELWPIPKYWEMLFIS